MNAVTETAAHADRSVKLERLRMMLLIRRFEERTYFEYTKPGRNGVPRIGGFVHLSSGQEALAVGVASVFRRGTDTLTCSYRCHGYTLALGTPPRAVMAELFGRSTGCCRGKGASMHLFDAARGNLGGWYVAGAQIPLGIGAAFAAWYRNTGGVCFVAFGDGAVNQGTFSESLNLASLWNLPAVFLVEDNGVAFGTSVERHSADPGLVRRGCGFAMPTRAINGNDLDHAIDVLDQAAARARAGGGPSYIVAQTYRFRGFAMSDAMRYRTRDELARASTRDPITVYVEHLKASGLLTEERVDAMMMEVSDEIEQAIRQAAADPDPPPEDRFKDVSAEDYPLQQ